MDSHQVRQSVSAYVATLEKLPAKQKDQAPTQRYAEDFNRLLDVAKIACPEIDSRLWPSPIVVRSAVGGMVVVEARYVEIETYARIMMNLIPTAPISVGIVRR